VNSETALYSGGPDSFRNPARQTRAVHHASFALLD
jgi:hypothetical protein